MPSAATIAAATEVQTLAIMKACFNRLHELSRIGVGEDELVALETALAEYEVALEYGDQSEPWEDEADHRYDEGRYAA